MKNHIMKIDVSEMKRTDMQKLCKILHSIRPVNNERKEIVLQTAALLLGANVTFKKFGGKYVKKQSNESAISI